MPPKPKTKEKKKGKGKSEPPPSPEPIEEIKDLICFKVHSFNNIKNLPLPFSIKLKLSLQNKLLDEKPPIDVENEDETILDEEFYYKTSLVGVQLFQLLLNNPFFFTVSAINVRPAVSNSKNSTAKTKATTAKSGSRAKSKSAEMILGSASFDILPLLLGRPDVENILVLESQDFVQGSETVSWPNLPFLTVSARVIDNILMSDEARPFNIIYITLESLYNFPAAVTNLSAALTFPVYENDVKETIIFENCQYKENPCPDEKKKWGTLPNITGRAALSEYLLNKTILTNSAAVNAKDLKGLSSYPRLEWNAIQRCWLLQSGQEIIFNRLTRFRCWPVEIFINEIVNPKGTKSKSKGGKETAMLMSKTHFVAYLDLTKLLYPGIDEVRVTSQLYTYVKNDLVNRSGQEESFFDKTVPSVENDVADNKPQTPKTAKKPKSTGKKKKVPDEGEEVSLPVFTEDGKPAFLIVQVQVLKPFMKKRTLEELESSIVELIPKRPPPNTALVNSEKAHKEFVDCIEELTGLLDKHFQEFVENSELEINEDIKKYFLTYIEELGVRSKLVNTLRDKVMDNVKLKIGLPKVTDSDLFFENYISDVYSRLVEQMLTVVNCMTDGHLTSQRASLEPSPIQVTTPELFFFSVEASEEDYFEKSKIYLLKRLNTNKKKPEFWLDLAVLLIKNGDFSTALEYVREVIILETRHKLGLLVYGILLCMKEDYADAELFFDAVTSFYPRFVEGWVTFHLFYVHLQKQEGADTTFVFAKKNEEFGPTQWSGSKQEQSLLSWCPHMVTCTPSLYLMTAVLLLRLHCFTFVEMCLAKEMETCENKEEISVSLLYCMAVCDYKQENFSQALSHLDAALHLDWKLPQLHSLMGHCYYRIYSSTKALESYDVVFSSEGTPTDLHLINLRAGYLFIENELYEQAKDKFLYVCKSSPTPQTWLGLGIACYRLKDFEDAECALSEANMLDNEMALVWAYLAMTNLNLGRAALFLDCFYQATHFGLDDPKVIQEIDDLKLILLREQLITMG